MASKTVGSPVSPLRIAVLGPGAIGSTFAFQLARTGGHEVTAIARPGSPRLHHLQRDGGVVNTKGERAEMEVADHLDETVPYDLIVVTLLSFQIDAVLPALQHSAARRIQFMFNTFDPERLQEAIGADRCSFGMPFVQATLDGEGHLNATIGAAGQKCKMDSQPSVDLFNAAGLPAVFEPRMLLWLRCHAPLCVAFESASVAGVRRGGGASWGQAMRIARGLKQGFVLIRRLGYPIYPAGKRRLDASPAWVSAGLLWCLSRIRSFRELLATGAKECRALIDVMVTQAGRVTPPVPTGAIAAMKPEEF